MKKLITILLVTVLTSCGAPPTPTNTVTPTNTETSTPTNTFTPKSYEKPTTNKDYKNIIGKPIKNGKLLVTQYDFPNEMDWYNAKRACAALGNGWRLPTLDETAILYQNKDKIGGFAHGEYDYYWSSNEFYGMNDEEGSDITSDAGTRIFFNGLQFYSLKTDTRKVRAVRSL